MAASLLEIMDACATQLDDLITPVSDIPVHFESRWFPIAETPAVDMRIGNPTGREQGVTGMSKTPYGAFPLTIRVRCGMAASIEGQDLLYQLIDSDGPLSIIAALSSDETLGGVCDALIWDSGFPWTGMEPYLDLNGDGNLAGSELPIVVVRAQS